MNDEADTERALAVPDGPKHHKFTLEEQARGGARSGAAKLQHGAFARPGTIARITNAKVNKLRGYIREHGARWLTEADEPLLLLAARNAVVADQIWSYFVLFQAIEIKDSIAQARPVLENWARINNVLSRQLTALGLGPVARAELGANVAGAKHDLARAMAQQHRQKQNGEADAGTRSPER